MPEPHPHPTHTHAGPYVCVCPNACAQSKLAEMEREFKEERATRARLEDQMRSMRLGPGAPDS